MGHRARHPALKWLLAGLGLVVLAVAAAAALHHQYGSYGWNALWRRGGSHWTAITPTDSRLPVPIQLALRPNPPVARAGGLTWRRLETGFDVAELPVLVAGGEVDRLLLARVDPAHYEFRVLNRPAGDRALQDWMGVLNARLVINGSYYGKRGTPTTPLVSDGLLRGPTTYSARHGAFVSSAAAASVVDLAGKDWRQALGGANAAMVSYPLLIGRDGKSRVKAHPQWLANRSFVGQDHAGRLVLGTTRQAFFSLERLADFLINSPLDLATSLNLDGGPVACQGIAHPDYRRDFCGDWEIAVRGGQLELLQRNFGNRRWALPIVLAVVPKLP